MKLTVTFLLLAAVSQAAKTSDFKAKQKTQATERIEKTEKRELAEGNSGIEKRTPHLPGVSSTVATGGVEYADSKDNLQDKSPTQQIYATPLPQVAKISDVLSGQGPQFQAAIANHLYSPISIYQPRLGSPTTYEVSAPVPSQLAYTEHRLSLPSPNSLQYATKPQQLTKPIITNYAQPQAYIHPSYEQNLLQLQSLYQQGNNYQPLQYAQPQIYNQQLQYVQQVQQPGIIYHREEQPSQYQPSLKQTEQRELQSPGSAQIEKQQIAQQDYNDKQQAALSYARFTFNQVPSHEQSQVQESVSPSPLPAVQQESDAQSLQHQPQQYSVQVQPLAQINYQLQHPSQNLAQVQYKTQQQIQQPKTQQQIQQPKQQQIQQQQIQYQGHQENQQPQLQYQHQQIQSPLQYQQPQFQYQEPQYIFQQQQLQQAQPLPNFHIQAQPQYQIQQYQLPEIQPQLLNLEKQELSKQSFPQRLFYKQPFQQQLIQPHALPQAQEINYKNIPVLPTFPPIQYFGKYAHSIFGNYHH